MASACGGASLSTGWRESVAVLEPPGPAGLRAMGALETEAQPLLVS